MIPTLDRDVLALYNVAKELHARSQVEFTWISLDTFNHKNSEKILNKLGIKFSRIEEYGERNVLKILDKEKPNAVIIINDFSFIERAFLYACHYRNIPCILIQSGEMSNTLSMKYTYIRNLMLWKRIPNMISRYRFICSTVLAHTNNPFLIFKIILKDVLAIFKYYDLRGIYGPDLITVNGRMHKKVLVEKGIEDHRIVVTGNPKLDYLTDATQKQHSNKMKPKIVILTSAQVEHGIWTHKQKKEYVVELLNSISPFVESTNITFKIHPEEEIKRYQEILVFYGGKIQIVQHEMVSDIINDADLILAMSSGSVIEALVLQKPVVMLPHPRSRYLPYVEYGVALEAKSLRQLPEIISDMLQNPEIRNNLFKNIPKYIFDYCLAIDGKSSSRVADAVLSLILKSNNLPYLSEMNQQSAKAQPT